MSAYDRGLLARIRDSWLGEKGLTTFLLLFFIGIFVSPLVDSLLVRLLTSTFFSLFVAAGSFSMAHRAIFRYLSGAMAVLVIVLRWLMHLVPSPAIVFLANAASLGFMVVLTTVIFSRVFRNSGLVTGHRVRGAIAVYLLFGITWSTLYALLDQVIPGAFSLPPPTGEFSAERQQSLTYYSFITLTTLGYGDITPTHDVSRMFAVMGALIGQLYPATLLARLVSLEIAHRGRDQT